MLSSYLCFEQNCTGGKWREITLSHPMQFAFVLAGTVKPKYIQVLSTV